MSTTTGNGNEQWRIDNGQSGDKGNSDKTMIVLIIMAVVFVVVLGAVLFLQRDRLSVMFGNLAETPAEHMEVQADGQDGAQTVFMRVNGDSAAARSFNVSMSGLVACDGDMVYYSQTNEVVDSGGATIYDEALFYMNARNGELFGITARGEIIRIDQNRQSHILRRQGFPSMLILDGDTLYFLEDGLWRMDLSGNDEMLVPGHIAHVGLLAENGVVYYIGAGSALYRTGVGGTVQLVNLPVERFSVDGDDVYFTLPGDATLFRLEEGGSHTAVTNAMTGAFFPRYAVIDGVLYFGAPGHLASRTTLATGDSEIISSSSSGLFYILNDELLFLEELPLPPEIIAVDREAGG